MSLALAIPVKDDHAALARLLRQAQQMNVFDQVVIVDDGSSPVIDIDGGRQGPWPLPVTVLCHEVPAGPGCARNFALEQVTADYMIYLDSDDRFTPDFARIWRAAQTQPFDLCIFRHHDTRQERIGRWGQMLQDDGIWRCAGQLDLGHAPMARVGEGARAHLAETANYPWNKIYRTDFLRYHGLGCAPCLVHEDIPLHWGALLHAETVLASPRVGVVHRVAEDGARLTNRRGTERLEVFGVLRRVLADLLAARMRRDLVPAFLRFSSGLFEWIRGQISADLVLRYRAELYDFLATQLTPALFEELSVRDPVLSLKLMLQMADMPLKDGNAQLA